MKKRIALWDNYKVFLIILVVLGHYTQQLFEDSATLNGMKIFIYSFHMPAFIFVTGLFSKRNVNEKNIKKVLPYITCFFATSLILFVTKVCIGWSPEIEILSPSGLPWYLMSMALMYLITMVLKDYKPQVVMIISITVGVMCGYCSTKNPDLFTWMRTIVFYPFFYLGYSLDQKRIATTMNKVYWKIIAVIFFVGLNVLIFSFPDEADKLSLLSTARHPYSQLGEFGPLGWLYRLLEYAVSFAATFLLISLMPQKEIKHVSKYGSRTLGIYMTHYVIIYILIYTLNIQTLLAKAIPSVWEYAFIPIAVATAYLCGNKWFNFVAQKLFSSKWKLKG